MVAVIGLLGLLGFVGYNTWQRQMANAGGKVTLGNIHAAESKVKSLKSKLSKEQSKLKKTNTSLKAAKYDSDNYQLGGRYFDDIITPRLNKAKTAYTNARKTAAKKTVTSTKATLDNLQKHYNIAIKAQAAWKAVTTEVAAKRTTDAKLETAFNKRADASNALYAARQARDTASNAQDKADAKADKHATKANIKAADKADAAYDKAQTKVKSLRSAYRNTDDAFKKLISSWQSYKNWEKANAPIAKAADKVDSLQDTLQSQRKAVKSLKKQVKTAQNHLNDLRKKRSSQTKNKTKKKPTATSTTCPSGSKKNSTGTACQTTYAVACPHFERSGTCYKERSMSTHGINYAAPEAKTCKSGDTKIGSTCFHIVKYL